MGHTRERIVLKSAHLPNLSQATHSHEKKPQARYGVNQVCCLKTAELFYINDVFFSCALVKTDSRFSSRSLLASQLGICRTQCTPDSSILLPSCSELCHQLTWKQAQAHPTKTCFAQFVFVSKDPSGETIWSKTQPQFKMFI